jgi:hypothetical protein
MNLRPAGLLVVGITIAMFLTPALSAQSVEINPYFGGVWPDSSHVGELKTNAIWGVRAGFHLDPNFAFEANVGYLNHFEVEGTDPKSRGILWEVAPTYSFSTQDWPTPKSFTPHLSFGLGGITTRLKNPSQFTYDVFENLQFVGSPPQTIVHSVQLQNRDTFFTVSAGGGFKVNPGPVGFRADIRARMLPNYYRASPIWLEATVGISFVLGQR